MATKIVNIPTAVAAIIVCSLCWGINAEYPTSAFQNLLGQVCGPPFGFLRSTCGPEIILQNTSIMAPEYLYG